MRLLAIACTSLGCGHAIAPAAEVRAPVPMMRTLEDSQLAMYSRASIDPLVCMPDTREYETSAPSLLIMPVSHEAPSGMPFDERAATRALQVASELQDTVRTDWCRPRTHHLRADRSRQRRRSRRGHVHRD